MVSSTFSFLWNFGEQLNRFDTLVLDSLLTVIFLDIFASGLFLWNLMICIVAIFFAWESIQLIWCYYVVFTTLRDPDKRPPSLRRTNAPIQAYACGWCIFTQYQLHPWMGSGVSPLTFISWKGFSPWLKYVSKHLFLIQTQHYPIAPIRVFNSCLSFALEVIQFVFCIVFWTLDAFFLLSRYIFAHVWRLILHCISELNYAHISFQSRLVDTWRTQRFLPICRVGCFLVDSLDADNASILRCFEAVRDDNKRHLINFFSWDVEHVYVENCANTHILNNRLHFVTFAPIRRGAHDRVSTVGGDSYPAGEGTVKWSWRNNDGRAHTYLLPNCRYYPNLLACILSPTQFGLHLHDCDRGTGIDSGIHSSKFYWSNQKFRRTIQHTSFMPRLPINDTASLLGGYLARFSSFFDDSPGYAFLSVSEYNRIFGTPTATQAVLGRSVRY